MLEVTIEVFQKIFGTKIKNPGSSSLTNVLTRDCISLLWRTWGNQKQDWNWHYTPYNEWSWTQRSFQPLYREYVIKYQNILEWSRTMSRSLATVQNRTGLLNVSKIFYSSRPPLPPIQKSCKSHKNYQSIKTPSLPNHKSKGPERALDL